MRNAEFGIEDGLRPYPNIFVFTAAKFVGDDAHIVPKSTQAYAKFPRNAEDGVPYRSCIFTA
ncbi:MAG: hypothetical protein ACI4JG_04375 [Acutalibacteraceae bacterium]